MTSTDLIDIGYVKFVQIQRSPMKSGEPRRYNPAPLLEVDELHITPTGLLGCTADGGTLMDVHNAAHPQSRYRGNNSVSFGFTGHYTLLRERYGAHLADGIAGENVIIESAHPHHPDELGEQLIIMNGDTGEQVVLGRVTAAAPCAEFSRFVAGRDLTPAEQKAALQFLNEGRRGFYAAPTRAQARIRPGDRVYIERNGA